MEIKSFRFDWLTQKWGLLSKYTVIQSCRGLLASTRTSLTLLEIKRSKHSPVTHNIAPQPQTRSWLVVNQPVQTEQSIQRLTDNLWKQQHKHVKDVYIFGFQGYRVKEYSRSSVGETDWLCMSVCRLQFMCVFVFILSALVMIYPAFDCTGNVIWLMYLCMQHLLWCP